MSVSWYGGLGWEGGIRAGDQRDALLLAPFGIHIAVIESCAKPSNDQGRPLVRIKILLKLLFRSCYNYFNVVFTKSYKINN